MIPATAARVEEHTAPQVMERIQADARDRLAAFSAPDRARLIDRRLAELDREWDVERALQANFALASLAALGLATGANRRWLALAVAVPVFMVEHALQGWCPPLAVLRRLGFRTSREINEERFALRAMRGDFAHDDAATSTH